MEHFDVRSREREYRITFGISLAASQLIFILLFNFWPQFEFQETVFDNYAAREIDMDMVEITQQPVQSPPPPPTPQVPVPVPDDYIVDEILDLEDLSDVDQPDFGDIDLPEAEGDEFAVHDNPQRPPNVTRIVEPVVSQEARRANIRAQIMVSFLVDESGVVEEVSIAEIRVFDEDDEYQVVEAIGYGLIEATLDAASKWRFRPAEDGGEQVRAVTRHMFTFGV